MGFFSSLFSKRKPAGEFPCGRVEFDDVRVTYRCEKRTDMIEWSDLVEVGIVTTDEGPFQEDVYFMLLGPNLEKGCAVPQGAQGGRQLLERLQRLPGFDNEAVIRAMGCTSNDRFVCWRKRQGP